MNRAWRLRPGRQPYAGRRAARDGVARCSVPDLLELRGKESDEQDPAREGNAFEGRDFGAPLMRDGQADRRFRRWRARRTGRRSRLGTDRARPPLLADQAVIAIENVRLVQRSARRKHATISTEALERQTATRGHLARDQPDRRPTRGPCSTPSFVTGARLFGCQMADFAFMILRDGAKFSTGGRSLAERACFSPERTRPDDRRSIREPTFPRARWSSRRKVSHVPDWSAIAEIPTA